jgi:Family of unknown function (DUF6188)
MHRIAENTNLSALRGKLVEQICIGVHQVIVRLEDNLYVAIEGDFLFGKEAPPERQVDYRSAANDFANLLEDRIIDAEVIRDDAVVFNFSSGARLTVFDSSDQYESFQIKLPDRLVVV